MIHIRRNFSKKNFINKVNTKLLRLTHKSIKWLCWLLGGHKRYSVIVNGENILHEPYRIVEHICKDCEDYITEEYNESKHSGLGNRYRYHD